MTKSELVLRLSKQYPHLYQRDIETLVNTIFDDISTTLVEGGRVDHGGIVVLWAQGPIGPASARDRRQA